MTDRLPCQTAGCGHTILPVTAEKTGGVCMPCVNRLAAEERARYVAAHRVDVDRFAGVDDVVEILLRMHRPPAPDPLVRLLPFRATKTELYRSLSQVDADRLLEAASSDPDLSRTVAGHLASLADVDLTRSQALLLQQGDPYPPYVFRRAAPTVVDALLSFLTSTAKAEPRSLYQHALRALAWTRAPRAVEALHAWSRGQSWQDMRFLHPESYAREAGYELEADAIRELTLPVSFQLVPGDGAAASVSLFEPDGGGARCVGCDGGITWLLRPDRPSTPEIPGAIPTCLGCACFGNVFFEVGPDLTFRALPVEAVATSEHPGWSRTPPPTRARLLARSRWEVVDWAEAEGLSQIGGHPSWIGDVGHTACVRCARTMTTVAQVDMSEHADGEGIFYAHHCRECAVVAVNYQQT